ncbi:hypothetical protein BYT27DRAFT_7197594 [Phlegmacium glaucopus]|nr:hypothetical protein BYT27DRAFT_7197594 [Phlegmacium glaucopus]
MLSVIHQHQLPLLPTIRLSGYATLSHTHLGSASKRPADEPDMVNDSPRSKKQKQSVVNRLNLGTHASSLTLSGAERWQGLYPDILHISIFEFHVPHCNIGWGKSHFYIVIEGLALAFGLGGCGRTRLKPENRRSYIAFILFTTVGLRLYPFRKFTQAVR